MSYVDLYVKKKSHLMPTTTTKKFRVQIKMCQKTLSYHYFFCKGWDAKLVIFHIFSKKVMLFCQSFLGPVFTIFCTKPIFLRLKLIWPLILTLTCTIGRGLLNLTNTFSLNLVLSFQIERETHVRLYLKH